MSTSSLILPELFLHFPRNILEQTGLFLAQTHLVKLTDISSSQAGTCGGWGLLMPHAQWTAILGLFVLDIHEGFLADSLPS